MKRCQGLTKKNQACKKRVGAKQDYCYLHVSQQSSEAVCPICTEDLETTQKLDCGHRIHLECIEKAARVKQRMCAEQGYPPVTNGECPICRSTVSQVIMEPLLWDGTVFLSPDQIRNIIKDFVNELDSIENLVAQILDPQFPDIVTQDDREEYAFTTAVALFATPFGELPRNVRVNKSGNMFNIMTWIEE